MAQDLKVIYLDSSVYFNYFFYLVFLMMKVSRIKSTCQCCKSWWCLFQCDSSTLAMASKFTLRMLFFFRFQFSYELQNENNLLTLNFTAVPELMGRTILQKQSCIHKYLENQVIQNTSHLQCVIRKGSYGKCTLQEFFCTSYWSLQNALAMPGGLYKTAGKLFYKNYFYWR